MARKALSETKKKQITKEIHAKWMARAVAMYQEEQERILPKGGSKAEDEGNR